SRRLPDGVIGDEKIRRSRRSRSLVFRPLRVGLSLDRWANLAGREDRGQEDLAPFFCGLYSTVPSAFVSPFLSAFFTIHLITLPLLYTYDTMWLSVEKQWSSHSFFMVESCCRSNFGAPATPQS